MGGTTVNYSLWHLFIYLFILNPKLHKGMHLTPVVLTLHVSTYSSHSLSPLILIPLLYIKSNQQAEIPTGLNMKFYHPTSCSVRILTHTCLSLGHSSQSQKGRVPPIGAQPESFFLSITTYPLSLLPQTHWHSTPTHWFTICFYTRTDKITVWAHSVTACTERLTC